MIKKELKLKSKTQMAHNKTEILKRTIKKQKNK